MSQIIETAGDLGPLVRERRYELGLTQEEVAAVARTGVRFISELETGKRSVQLDTLLKVLTALGLQLTVSAR